MGGEGSGRPKRFPPAKGIEPWPAVVSTDPDVEHIRRIVVALNAVIEEQGFRSSRAVAAKVGIGHQALADLRAGRTWPEATTIARIERGLGVRLWPERRDEA